MEAKCVDCRHLVPAHYDFRGSDVFLVRLCGTCGDTETLVSTDASYFEKALAIASTGAEVQPQGLIVELLDQCDIQCPTCIAGSGPLLRNLRDPDVIERKLQAVRDRQALSGVLLSGGEPAIHPRLFDFIGAVDRAAVSRKVLITNGLLLARDRSFADHLVGRLANGWEVFLQFDVLDGAILRDIRGSDFVEERLAAVERLGDARIPTTLVAVAKRNVSLERVHETVSFGLDRPWIRGVQIQPIREAGRLENYKSSDNTCLASDVHRVLRESHRGIKFEPYQGSPLSVSLAYFDRKGAAGWFLGPQPSEMYIEPSTEPVEHFRVSVMEYSDEHNWSSLRLRQSPLAVLQADGAAKRVDDHWNPVQIDLGPLRVK